MIASDFQALELKSVLFNSLSNKMQKNEKPNVVHRWCHMKINTCCITLTQIDIICLIQGHNLLPILRKKTENTIKIFNSRIVLAAEHNRKKIPSDHFALILNPLTFILWDEYLPKMFLEEASVPFSISTILKQWK